jgi:hypothetical protein
VYVVLGVEPLEGRYECEGDVDGVYAGVVLQ